MRQRESQQAAAEAPGGSLADRFARDGFVVVRNVFSAPEIEDMRACVRQQIEVDRAEGKFEDAFYQYMGVRSGRGDLLSKIHLRGILLDPRILDTARSLLPAKPLLYFGESTYQLGSSGRYFHRDNVDRGKAEGPDWCGDYPLLRMGIYLQDHRRHSGGLKVRIGSHRHDGGRACLVDSEPGDVVVWNMRTLHSGNAVRLRFWPSFAALAPNGQLRRLRLGEDMIPGWLQLPVERERAALFMSYGVESPHLDRYIAEFLGEYEEPGKATIAGRFGEEVWDMLQQRGVKVCRLHPGHATNWRALK
jgi:hypothetical protein